MTTKRMMDTAPTLAGISMSVRPVCSPRTKVTIPSVTPEGTTGSPAPATLEQEDSTVWVMDRMKPDTAMTAMQKAINIKGE